MTSAKTPATASRTAARPLWSSSKINTVSATQTGLKRVDPSSHQSRPFAASTQAPPLRAVNPRKSSSPRASAETPARSSLQAANKAQKPNSEPIKTYLRIRPPGEGVPAVTNYVRIVNEQEIILTPPADHRTNIYGSQMNLAAFVDGRTDPSSSAAGTAYRFTHVFSPLDTGLSSSQGHFFEQTALPLVKDFLHGENCLMFAYGTTGSGKTWTVQGGEGEDAGLLPRVMDLVCRSLEDKQSTTSLKPVGLSNVQVASVSSASNAPFSSTPSKKASGLGVGQAAAQAQSHNVIPVDDSYEYSTWVSYAEVYNEKIYDLLDSPVAQPAPSQSSQTSMFSFGLLGVGAKAKGLMRNLTTVKRNALSLKHDKDGGSKYVHGMKEVRVRTAEEARQLLEKGQNNRRVFSTLANRASSRSHSIFTIKIVKTKKGARVDPASASTNMFSLVDLAGSERQINTGTDGDRLKEAGKINTSLMVLGQCMDTLRRNQELGPNQKPTVVPFRHSKLTELFQSFFVGHGKAVMVVNVDPWSTSFDENAHVMKFSAVAKAVVTTKQEEAKAAVAAAPAAAFEDKAKKAGAQSRKRSETRIVRVSLAPGAAEEDVIYEEEEDEEVERDAEADPFVTTLLDEIESLRAEVYEAKMERAMAEHRTRTSVSAHYEQKILEVERYYKERLRSQADEAEKLQNAKLDIIAAAAAASSSGAGPAMDVTSPASTSMASAKTALTSAGDQSFASYDDSSDEEGGGQDRQGNQDESNEEVEQILLSEPRSVVNERYESDASPLAAVSSKARALVIDDSPIPAVRVVDYQVAADDDEVDEVESEEEEEEVDASDEYEEEEADEDDDDDFVPERRASTASASKARSSRSRVSAVPQLETLVAKTPMKAARFIDEDDEQGEEDKSTVILLGSAKTKKPKRMLGGSKGMSMDDLHQLADELAPPVTATPKTSFGSHTGSIRSIKRVY